MQFILKKCFKFLLQGLIVVAPVAITCWLIVWLFSSLDNLLPIFTKKDVYGNIIGNNYGLGVLIIISSLIIIGYLSTNFLTRKLFSFFDDLLEKAPGVKMIYSSVKDFFEAFAGDKRKFTKPVLVRIRNNPEIFQVGFLTQENLNNLHLENKVAVYMPHSYAVSGYMLIVNKEDITHLTNISSGDAMKMAVSGGVAGYEDEEVVLDPKQIV
jgi:uncharacterized membrane protein